MSKRKIVGSPRIEYYRKWNRENKDKVKEKHRRYYVRHRKKVLRAVKKYSKENREKINERMRKYYWSSPEQRRKSVLRSHNWQKKNREKYNAYQRERRKKLKRLGRGK